VRHTLIGLLAVSQIALRDEDMYEAEVAAAKAYDAAAKEHNGDAAQLNFAKATKAKTGK